MASTPQPPNDDVLKELNWDSLQASARRRLRARLSGFGTHDLEDAVQDVAERLVRFVRRHGSPESPEALLVHIVRAVASDAIKRRQHERRLGTGQVRTWVEDSPQADGEDEILEEYVLIVFHVREYLRLRRAHCLPLADAKARGESLKEFALRQKRSYEGVRQAWSRCVRLIHDAIRRKRLRLSWPMSWRRRTSGE
jgi:DNA-directed RNA polymerase specialized sigma24 family protein